jgi:exopolysaccharide biosynthesis polyprenyl glycosylphosphotransferase
VNAFINRYQPWSHGINIVGCRFMTPVAANASAVMREATLDQDFDEAVASVRSLAPDAVFLLLPWSATDAIQRCAEIFTTLPVEIHVGPEPILYKFEEVKLSKLGPMTSLQLTRRPLSRMEIARKRAFDLVAAALALIALTPLLVAVALLVWMDSPGPIFFVQRRYGFNQEPFRIIKFRTMRTLDDGPVVAQATRDDPRLTRVGRFLRRWNIDEIPQLFNVLTGDMSLVGPRPLLPADQPDDLEVRLMVRPGLTGWAQVCGGKLISADEKNALDAWYIRHASLWLDVKIIMRTIWMLSATGDRRDEKAISIALLDRSYGEVVALPHAAAAAAARARNEPDGIVKSA